MPSSERTASRGSTLPAETAMWGMSPATELPGSVSSGTVGEVVWQGVTGSTVCLRKRPIWMAKSIVADWGTLSRLSLYVPSAALIVEAQAGSMGAEHLSQ